jgi:hypothetical protein
MNRIFASLTGALHTIATAPITGLETRGDRRTSVAIRRYRNAALPLRYLAPKPNLEIDAMRHPLMATTLILATAAAMTLVPNSGFAQSKQGQPPQGQSGQVPLPQGGFKPPPAAPIKPYQPLAVTPPATFNDPSFDAFRKQLAAIAEKKDRAAVAKLVVASGFFWMQEKDLADKKKPGMANFANAIDLDAKDGSGWETLSGYANEETAEPLPDHQGVICAPAEPSLDPKAFEALVAATKTEPPEWGYPTKDGVEVRSAGKPDAPVIEKLGMTLVRVLPDNGGPDNPNQSAFLHIATPSGKSGFVPMDAVASIGGDQICYMKDGGGWKISGYFGGASQ